jgi:hypothetical protein
MTANLQQPRPLGKKLRPLAYVIVGVRLEAHRCSDGGRSGWQQTAADEDETEAQTRIHYATNHQIPVLDDNIFTFYFKIDKLLRGTVSNIHGYCFSRERRFWPNLQPR